VLTRWRAPHDRTAEGSSLFNADWLASAHKTESAEAAFAGHN
jgi:hypothetical protein